MRVTLHAPALADVLELATSMRADDVAECLASDGLSPVEALRQSLEASAWATTVRVSGEVAGIAGVSPFSLLGDSAQTWLLTGYAIERAPLEFFRAAKAVVGAMLERWCLLVSAIDARYTKAVRFFRMLGFVIEPAAPFGAAGLPFHRAVLRRETWVS